ncbi:hypothetical protein ACHHYP_13648 [Achlya hypogyna]|uniref:Uncharacterized protein n=1 Tax=Achlya hypogyna TaxID=1202772 RepID=A0A1V9ZFJ9_ACHHY|nr:hypothetical protein ACHHYP_13648 [Achlya hypogyna]
MAARWWPFVASWAIVSLLVLECPRMATPTHLTMDTMSLEQLTHSSARVLTLDEYDYRRHVLRSSRQYGLIVLITASAPTYKCEMCGPLEIEFRAAAEHYAQHRTGRRNAYPLYFAVLDFDHFSDFFVVHSITTVPLLGYFEPKATQRAEATIRLSATNTVPTAGSIIEYCNVVHGTDIPRPVYFRRTFTISSILALFFSATTHYMGKHLDVVVAAAQSGSFWCALSLGIYFASMGGLVFSATTSLAPLKPGERTTWVHPHPHQQYLGEALIVILLNVVIVYCLWRLADYKMSRSAAITGLTVNVATYEPPAVSLKALHQTVHNAFVVAVLLYAVALLGHLFQLKHREYSVWVTLPPAVQAALRHAYVSPTTGWFFQLLDKLSVWLLRDI